VCSQLHAPAALPPVPIGYEVGWAPEPVCVLWREVENGKRGFLSRSGLVHSYA
jgi:hypothetical protein